MFNFFNNIKLKNTKIVIKYVSFIIINYHIYILINLIISLIKKYNIYLYRPIYFSKNSNNHPVDDTWLRKHKQLSNTSGLI